MSAVSADELKEQNAILREQVSSLQAQLTRFIEIVGDTPHERLMSFCNAEHDEMPRVFILPKGYEYSQVFYHIVMNPLHCTENGDGCDGCDYEQPDNCTFRPHVEKVTDKEVFLAMHTLFGLELTDAAAQATLVRLEGTGQDEPAEER